jgi:hypothetical protein
MISVTELSRSEKQNTRVIGIDPDFIKSGVGVVDSGTLVELKSFDFWRLIAFIDENKSTAVFALEDVEANRPTFGRDVNQRTMQKISQNVGQVKAVARLLKQFLDLHGVEYHMVRPLGGSSKACKKNADLFCRYTGWAKSSNEDQRDAAMLALHVASTLGVKRG